MTAQRAPEDRFSMRLALAVSVLAIAGTHALLIGYKTFANVDEAYALSIASRLLDGQKLYEGAVSQRGPLMYYTYEAIAKAFGWDNIVGLRIVALVFALAHLGLVYAFARRFFGPRATVLATLLTGYTLSLGLPAYDRYALNGEYLQIPLLLAGAFLATLALRRAVLGRATMSKERRRALVFLAGVLVGAAISVKQSVALHTLPIVVFVIARSLRTRDRSARMLTLVHLAGVALIPIAFLIHASAQGTLTQLLYYTVEYNVLTHVGAAASFTASIPALTRELDLNPVFGITIVIACAGLVGSCVAPFRAALRKRSVRPIARRFDVEAHVALQLVVGLLGAASLRRFFPHYFIPALPFLALVLGSMARHAWRARSRISLRHLTYALSTALFLVGGLQAYQLEKVDARVTHDRGMPRLASWIEATTQPTDRIFVWGFSPWLYPYSHRKPAGRFVFETYPTGFVPWFHEDLAIEMQRVVPGSMQSLLVDLERESPELVVDAGAVMIARSMRTYPPASQWLHAHYCFEVRVPGYDVYRKKKADSCASEFPIVQHAYDFVGRPYDVPMPTTYDADVSDYLETPDTFVPAWFPEAPRPPKVELLYDPLDVRPGARLEGADRP